MREKLSTLKKRIKNQKGFTLIELMATLVILAIIVAIAVPAVGNITEKAKTQAAAANIELIENSAELAHIGGLTPSTGALNTDGATYTANDLIEGGYLKAELKDVNGMEVALDKDNGNVFKIVPGKSVPTPVTP